MQLQRLSFKETIASVASASSLSSKTGTLELPPSDATSGQGGRYSGQINSAGATLSCSDIMFTAASKSSCIPCNAEIQASLTAKDLLYLMMEASMKAAG